MSSMSFMREIRGGHATLYKSVLSHIPTFYISIFLMPETVIQLVERLRRNFWKGYSGEN